MKSFGLGLILTVAFGAFGAWGSPLCTDQSATGVGGSTLNYYVALGSGGCIMNGALFSNFTYTYTVSGSGVGAQTPSSAVSVTADGSTSAFIFNSTWITTSTQVGTLSLTFNVSAPAYPVDSLRSSFTGFAGGGLLTPLATCTGGTCGTPTTFTNTTVSIPNTGGPLAITDAMTLNANGGTVHVSVISDQFGIVVPEPATYGMLGVGMGLLAFLRRRK